MQEAEHPWKMSFGYFYFPSLVLLLSLASFCGRYCIFPALCLAANSHNQKYFCYGATSQAAAQVLVEVSQGRQQPSFTSFFEISANSRQRFPLCDSLWLVLMSPFILFSAFLRVSVKPEGAG